METLLKAKKILAVVKRLTIKYGVESFKIKDFWDGDLLSIGLSDKSEKFLIYISIYKQDREKYFVLLEDLSSEEEFAYLPKGDFENVTFEELEKHFVEHLKIKTT